MRLCVRASSLSTDRTIIWNREAHCQNSIEPPGPVLSWLLQAITTLRIYALRYVCLPRPTWLAVRMVSNDADPASGFYNFHHSGFRPWYIKPSFWSKWSPGSLLLQAVGGKSPGDEKYQSQGYNLETIGPQPQQGKGIEEMRSNVEYMQRSVYNRCPFSQRSKT